LFACAGDTESRCEHDRLMANIDIQWIDGDGADRVIQVLEAIEQRTVRRVRRWELLKILANALVVLLACTVMWFAFNAQIEPLWKSQRDLWIRFDAITNASPSPG